MRAGARNYNGFQRRFARRERREFYKRASFPFRGRAAALFSGASHARLAWGLERPFLVVRSPQRRPDAGPCSLACAPLYLFPTPHSRFSPFGPLRRVRKLSALSLTLLSSEISERSGRIRGEGFAFPFNPPGIIALASPPRRPLSSGDAESASSASQREKKNLAW